MPQPPPDLSGDLLSAAATFALQTNLRSSSSIDAAVDCTLPGLLMGQVDGVVISGSDWASRKNLTCEKIAFHVGTVAIDQAALVTERVVKLKSVATGDAELVFSAEDFGNFLVHPLTAAAAESNGPGGHNFVFDGPNGSDAAPELEGRVQLKEGAVCFSGTWGRDGGWYRVAMRPDVNGGGVSVETLEAPAGVGLGGGGGGEELAAAMAAFFAGLMIDLRGAQLSYRSMTVTDTRVQLFLTLRVVSFPPPNAAF